MGPPIDFNLRASLAMKPIMDINKLMERVKEYKRLEDDQVKANVPTTEKKEVKEKKLPNPEGTFSFRLRSQGSR